MNKEINNKLLKAAAKGNIKEIERALMKGASLKARDEKKLTALTIAAVNGHNEAVQLLLDNNAPVTNETLHLAEISPDKNIEIIKVLQIAQMMQVKPQTKFNSTVDTNVLNASYRGDIIKLKKYLGKYGDVDAIDGSDTSALRWASRFGHHEIIKELIKAGANVNLKSKTGWTALMEAIVAGSPEIVELLIKYGADVNAKTFVNASPLYFAAEKGIDEITKLLKKHKAVYSPPQI